MLITLEEAKQYLRVDTHDDDDLINQIIASSEELCADVARISKEELLETGDTIRLAILYAIAYMYEHREDADYRMLPISLRSLLFGVRKEGF